MTTYEREYNCVFRFDLEKEEWSGLSLPEADKFIPHDEVESIFFLEQAVGVLCLTCVVPFKRLENMVAIRLQRQQTLLVGEGV